MIDVQCVLVWSSWQPLDGSWSSPETPADPGLYRIRRVGFDGVDYIGQTGTTLRTRLGMLRGVYAEEMPYSDPHTAAPSLWALRHTSGCDFEASVVPVAGSGSWRKGLEALAIALYRQERGVSPTANWGRILPGYTKSSGNSRRLVAAGKRVRGGSTGAVTANHDPGIPPTGPLDDDVQGPTWCGHAWSAWMPVTAAVAGLDGGATGLYRLRSAGSEGLVYVGQGGVRGRLGQHLQTAGSSSAQGREFGDLAKLECSWVVNAAWLPNQRLEMENDLIAAHVLWQDRPPAGQFLGGGSG